MTSGKAQQILLVSRPEGPPTPENFRLEDMDMPVPGPGQILVEAAYLSLDPYMRGRMSAAKSYAPPVELGTVMAGETVGTVLASQHPDFQVGDWVAARTGWRSHAAVKGTAARKIDVEAAPASTYLGVLGMPGFTAYCGLMEIGKPKAGETLVVAAASGPVGSLVGQLARRLELTTIGIAGGPEKCKALTELFGFDRSIDHHDADLEANLAEACPKGIDIYFENVGGRVWNAVFPLLNQFARVPVCGVVSLYSGETPSGSATVPELMQTILRKSLTLRGFINYDLIAYYPAFLREVVPAVQDGSIRYKEDVVEGLAAAPEAFMGMLKGKNFGKLLVKLV